MQHTTESTRAPRAVAGWTFRALLLLVLAGGPLGCASPRLATEPDLPDAAAVRAVLDAQVAAWNAGDLEGFMAGYARTDTLRFASGGSVRYGWQATLDGYRRGYPDRAAMGTLAFENLDIRVLSPRHALAFGGWRLRYPDQPDAAGLFTLLLERAGADAPWRVVHDHTSSAE